MKLHHVAIAVSDLDAAIEVYKEFLGVEPAVKEYEPHNLRWAVFPIGESEIQLCQNARQLSKDEAPHLPEPTHRYSDFINEHGEGIHHVCIQVQNLRDSLAALTSGRITVGAPTTDDKPSIGPSAQFVFLDRSSLRGLNVELLEIPGEQV